MKLALINKKEIVGGVWEMIFDTRNQNFSFKAGQYIRLVLPKLDIDDTKGPARLFSIASSPNDKEKLSIVFRASESGFKKTLINMPIGSEAEIEGPWGSFILPQNSDKPIVFIAGGTGIAPFLSMLRFVAEEKLPHRIVLLYASQDKENIIYFSELKKLASQNPKIKICLKFGLIEKEFIRKNSPKDFNAFYYISGSSAMVDGVRSILQNCRAPEESVYYEEWSSLDFLKAPVRNMLEISADAIFLTDLAGIIKYANPAWEKLTGWLEEEVVDKCTPRIQKSGKQSAEFYKKLWSYHMNGLAYRHDVVNKRKDGTLYDIDHLYLPLFSEAKEIVGFAAFQRDISEEKSKQYEQDRAILASIGEMLVVVDKEGKILMANKIFEEMLEVKDIIGQYYFNVWQMKEGERPLSLEERPIYLALANGKQVFTDKYAYATSKGKSVPVALTVAPVAINGKIFGAVAVLRDITKEKEIEKMRLDFLSLAPHQLRTPLSGTKWLIEMLKSKSLGPLTKKQKEYLNQVYQMNERMIELVSNMLNVLRLEAGATLVKKEVISISSLYEELFSMMSSAAKNKGVLLRNVFKNHKAATVETDAQMLRTILEVFISNAINYSSPGQEIIMEAKEEPAAVVFFVKDGGIGIPKEEQKRIFEKFFRASNAKKFKLEGTGLGLYIVSLLADKMGAEISFESEEGKGSTFYLRVPKKEGNIFV